ncbi:MAG: orotate phosphoribosyltransferase [archaeon]
MTIAEDTAKILLEIKAVTLDSEKPYRYASGILSPIYCDNRILISDVTKREKIISFFIQKIKENNLKFDIVAGVATAGIPHAAWIAEKLKKPMIYIRSSAKDHGKHNLIEGRLEKWKKVLVIEDLISTGGSTIDAVNAVREASGIVTDCMAIFTYDMKKAIDRFEEADCTLHTLSSFSILIDVAGKKDYLNKDAKEKVLKWNKDPAGWGKKMGYE